MIKVFEVKIFMPLLSKIKEMILRKKTLQTHLMSQIVFLLVTSMSAVIFENYSKSTKNILRVADQELTLVMKCISKPRIDENIQIAEEAKEVFFKILPIAKNLDKEIWIFNLMSYFVERNPYVSSIIFGTPSGFFLDVSASRIYKERAKRLSLSIPKNTTAVVKILNVGKGGKETNAIWNYIENQKTITKTDKGEITGFDHRTRPWYLDAIKTKKSVWTGVYTFSDWSALEPGITYAQSVFDNNGKLLGVLGVDVSLRNLSKMLSFSTNITKNTNSYIVENNTHVIVCSTGSDKAESYGEKDFNYLIASKNDIRNKILTKALLLKRDSKSPSLIFSYNNDQYIAYFQKFTQFNFPHAWECVVITPVKDFTSSIQSTRNSSVMYSLVILVLAMMWSFHLSRRISKPMISLAKETNHLQRLELNDSEPIESHIKEITILRDAIVNLKTTMRSFSYYIPKDLVKKLLSRKRIIHTGGRAKEVAIMFTDIQNFTNEAEALSPDKVIKYLSEYFEELTSIVMTHNGTVDKFIGDAIMAFWGMTSTDKNLAFNACHSALLCQNRLQTLNRIWAQEQRPTFVTRFGLHMGMVVMGNVGSSDRMNYTAVGDNVNLSSRLEALNKYYGTKIIVSEAIYQATKNNFLFRRLDDIAVKGKKNTITVYELVGQIEGDEMLYPTQYQFEFCAHFEEARLLYITRQWTEALEAFTNLLKYPHETTDKTLQLYIKRCNEFIANPPPQEWNGTVRLYEK